MRAESKKRARVKPTGAGQRFESRRAWHGGSRRSVPPSQECRGREANKKPNSLSELREGQRRRARCEATRTVFSPRSQSLSNTSYAACRLLRSRSKFSHELGGETLFFNAFRDRIREQTRFSTRSSPPFLVHFIHLFLRKFRPRLRCCAETWNPRFGRREMDVTNEVCYGPDLGEKNRKLLLEAVERRSEPVWDCS